MGDKRNSAVDGGSFWLNCLFSDSFYVFVFCSSHLCFFSRSELHPILSVSIEVGYIQLTVESHTVDTVASTDTGFFIPKRPASENMFAFDAAKLVKEHSVYSSCHVWKSSRV